MKGSHENTTARRVLFVLGSGVSSFCCPDVEQITQNVLSPDTKCFGYDADGESKALVGFLNVLQDQARSTTGAVTYEDLFSMCEHLQKWELNLIRDPAIRLFRNQIFAESKEHWDFYADDKEDYFPPLAAIALKAQHMILRVIQRQLVDQTEPLQQLDLIADTIEQLGPENVDILTLNHDLLVESLLDHRKIAWTDGFDPVISTDGEVVNFDTKAFEDKGRIRIVKLHGGCNWAYAGTKGDIEHDFRWVKNPTTEAIDLCHDHLKQLYIDDSERAATLTGTTTKAASYTEGLHGELYIVAKQLLTQYDRIICSGYGWNDYGFNTMLHEWGTRQDWHEDERRFPRLLLLHKDADLEQFRPLKNPPRLRKNLWFWPKNWEEDTAVAWPHDHHDWMRCHKKWLSCTRLNDIKGVLFD